jgi:hypothetical protein
VRGNLLREAILKKQQNCLRIKICIKAIDYLSPKVPDDLIGEFLFL